MNFLRVEIPALVNHHQMSYSAPACLYNVEKHMHFALALLEKEMAAKKIQNWWHSVKTKTVSQMGSLFIESIRGDSPNAVANLHKPSTKKACQEVLLLIEDRLKRLYPDEEILSLQENLEAFLSSFIIAKGQSEFFVLKNELEASLRISTERMLRCFSELCSLTDYHESSIKGELVSFYESFLIYMNYFDEWIGPSQQERVRLFIASYMKLEKTRRELICGTTFFSENCQDFLMDQQRVLLRKICNIGKTAALSQLQNELYEARLDGAPCVRGIAPDEELRHEIAMNLNFKFTLEAHGRPLSKIDELLSVLTQDTLDISEIAKILFEIQEELIGIFPDQREWNLKLQEILCPNILVSIIEKQENILEFILEWFSVVARHLLEVTIDERVDCSSRSMKELIASLSEGATTPQLILPLFHWLCTKVEEFRIDQSNVFLNREKGSVRRGQVTAEREAFQRKFAFYEASLTHTKQLMQIVLHQDRAWAPQEMFGKATELQEAMLLHMISLKGDLRETPYPETFETDLNRIIHIQRRSAELSMVAIAIVMLRQVTKSHGITICDDAWEGIVGRFLIGLKDCQGKSFNDELTSLFIASLQVISHAKIDLTELESVEKTFRSMIDPEHRMYQLIQKRILESIHLYFRQGYLLPAQLIKCDLVLIKDPIIEIASELTTIARFNFETFGSWYERFAGEVQVAAIANFLNHRADASTIKWLGDKVNDLAALRSDLKRFCLVHTAIKYIDQVIAKGEFDHTCTALTEQEIDQLLIESKIKSAMQESQTIPFERFVNLLEKASALKNRVHTQAEVKGLQDALWHTNAHPAHEQSYHNLLGLMKQFSLKHKVNALPESLYPRLFAEVIQGFYTRFAKIIGSKIGVSES